MDSLVEAALLKWPNVPHCHGWLAFDARGDWYMRDDPCQAAGPFPHPKGSVIRHDKLLGFINRNLALDAQGAVYFQNGPQRVFVDVEAAPWVWRIDWPEGQSAPRVRSHADLALPDNGGESAGASGNAKAEAEAITRGAQPDAAKPSAWLDERGRLFLHTERGFGIVHSMDMLQAARALEAGCWPLQEMPFAQMPQHFGYQLRPRV